MCCSFLFFHEISVNLKKYLIYKIGIFPKQRILFCLEELITFFLPGIIWFYYGFNSIDCLSPVDADISFMVICYFVCAILLLIPALNTCLNRPRHFCFVKIAISIYFLGKLVIIIIMLAHIQNDYYHSWEDNTCKNIKPWTLFWLIWNYFILSFSFICFLSYIGSLMCDYDYEDYDYDY